MKALQAEIARLFGDINFDDMAEVVEPQYQCETCQDMGVIRVQVADIHDPRFGKLFPCPNTECPTRRQQDMEKVNRYAAVAEWEKDYTAWTFDSFVHHVAARFEAIRGTLSPEVRKRGAFEGKRGGYAAARYFAEHVGQDFSLGEATEQVWNAKYPGTNADRLANSVVLRGDVGLGKTGLAVAAVNLMRADGHAVVFDRVQGIIRRIQDTYGDDDDKGTLNDVLAFYSSAPVLVIDEFGMEQYKADRLEKFEEILRTRDRKHLPWLLTTNLTTDEMYKFWHPRIADVVAKAHQVTIGGVKLRDTASREEVVW